MLLQHKLFTRESSSALQTRDAVARPNTWNESARTIEAIVATANPVGRRDASGEYDEVLDLAGADLEALRGAHVLDGHRQLEGVAAVIGAVADVRREGEALIATLRLSSRPELAGVVGDIRDGILNAVSIGYEILEARDSVGAGGRRVRTAVRWRPREVSFVGVGADPAARTRARDPAPGSRTQINRTIRELAHRAGVTTAIVDNLIDSEATVDQARAAIFDDMLTRSRLPIRIGLDHDAPDATAQAIRESIYARMAGTAPTERARPYMHRSMIDLMRDTLGATMRTASPGEVYAAAMRTRAAPGMHSTSDFPVLLGDVMGRRLGELFRAAESGASAIVATGTARDFRPVTEGRLTSFPSLEPVNEAGEIRWGSLDEEGELLAIASYARAIAVSFKLMVNDDLNAIDRSIRDVAYATAQLKGKLIVAALAALLRDGKALFHADHANLADTGAAPDEDTLSDGRIALMKQTPPGSDEPLGLSPAIILCPAELQTTAEKLVAAITPASTENVNVFAGRLSVAVEPRLATATEWYLFAAPGTYPVIRFLTLQGYEQPRFETNAEFDRLGTSYRVHWHVGAGPVDHRGAWKNAGAQGGG